MEETDTALSRLGLTGTASALLNHPSAAPFDVLDTERTLMLCPCNRADTIAKVKKAWVKISGQNAIKS